MGVSQSNHSQPAYSRATIHQSESARRTKAARQHWAERQTGDQTAPQAAQDLRPPSGPPQAPLRPLRPPSGPLQDLRPPSGPPQELLRTSSGPPQAPSGRSSPPSGPPQAPLRLSSGPQAPQVLQVLGGPLSQLVHRPGQTFIWGSVQFVCECFDWVETPELCQPQTWRRSIINNHSSTHRPSHCGFRLVLNMCGQTDRWSDRQVCLT